MQTLCVSSNWPSVEALHPRQLDIFVHCWQDDCPPPDVNGAAPAVTAPAVPGQGVGTPPVIRRCDQLVTGCASSVEYRHEYVLSACGMSLDAPVRIPYGGCRSWEVSDGAETHQFDSVVIRPGTFEYF